MHFYISTGHGGGSGLSSAGAVIQRGQCLGQMKGPVSLYLASGSYASRHEIRVWQASLGDSNGLGESITWQIGTVYHIDLLACFVGVPKSYRSVPMFPLVFIAATRWLL